MKKLLIVVVLVIAIAGLSVFGAYMGRRGEIASRHQAVDQAWSKVHSAMRYRADLVPDVIAGMRGMAARNRAIVAEVEQSREEFESAATPVNIIAANRHLDAATARLFASAQDDPDLITNRKFFVMQDRWATATNRIAPEIVRFDKTVQNYNAFIAEFPNDLFARWASFAPVENYFSVDANAASHTTAELMRK